MADQPLNRDAAVPIETPADDAPAQERAIHNSLDALGIVGLRTTDLMVDNMACCGDCRNAVPGVAPFRCRAGYDTTIYSVKAVYCPDFTPHDALSDAPQTDDRSGTERRHRRENVPSDRRSGIDRRRDPDRWKRAENE